MKKPHGLYLPETPHNRVTTYVRNTLDGKGSLPGFIAFVEDVAFNAFHKGEVLNDAQEYAHDTSLKSLGSLQLLPASKAKAPLDEYLQAWESFENETPMLKSAARHLVGLYLLADSADLWQPKYQPDRLFEEYRDRTLLAEVVEEIRERGAPSTPRRAAQKRHPIIRRNRIELTQDPYASGKVSLTLDDEHHAFLNRVFGPSFYARLEHVLVEHFESHELVHDLRAIGRFLEWGVDAYDAEKLQNLVRRILNYERDKHVGLHDADPSEEDWLHLIKSSVREGFQLLWVRDEDEFIGIGDWISGVDYRPEDEEAYLALLKLAVDLDILDDLNVLQLPEKVERTLKERFNMRPLSPTRDNLRAYLDGVRATPSASYTTPDAVDYHIWSLFKLYASETLGEDLDSSALRDDYLATLAQPMWFAIDNTLQVFTGLQTKRGERGEWLLMKGADVQHSLSTQCAQRITELLQLVVNPFNQVLRVSRGGLSQTLPELRRVPDLHIPVGLESVQRAEELLHDNQFGRTTALELLILLIKPQLDQETLEKLMTRVDQSSPA